MVARVLREVPKGPYTSGPAQTRICVADREAVGNTEATEAQGPARREAWVQILLRRSLL